MNQSVILIDDQQHATILAALRFYQQEGMGDPAKRSDAIHDIATNMDEVISLDEAGIDELVAQLQFPSITEVSSASDVGDVDEICGRLLNSDEHAGEAAIPDVAEDAVEFIRRLSDTLGQVEAEKQNLVSERDEALQFVDQVAGLSIWDYDKNDGSTYLECEEPSEGHMDSHCCLMALIEQARDGQKESK